VPSTIFSIRVDSCSFAVSSSFLKESAPRGRVALPEQPLHLLSSVSLHRKGKCGLANTGNREIRWAA
jgi:hypothetical protein